MVQVVEQSQEERYKMYMKHSKQELASMLTARDAIDMPSSCREKNFKFRAKDLKTGEWVEGDLIYAKVRNFRTWPDSGVMKPMIVNMHIHGGMLWAGSRYFIDESTIELIKVETGAT